jgi:hypothetical protein
MKPSYLVLALKILAVFPFLVLYGGVTAIFDGRLAMGAAIVFGAVLLSGFIMWMALILEHLIKLVTLNDEKNTL